MTIICSMIVLVFNSCIKNGENYSTNINQDEIFDIVNDLESSKYRTKNVIILVIDGPRYSETWGDPGHKNIPKLHNELSKKGVVSTNFFNDGPTYTCAGHTAITTGNYQEINNSGKELPKFPSMFQYWSKTHERDSLSAWVIASKDKLQVLANTNNEDWKDRFRPSTNCGIEGKGLGSGYRSDEETMERTLNILSKYHPSLVLINLKDPDYYAHRNDWNNYIKGIENSDEYLSTLWNYIQTDSLYSNNTTLFVTNDHGRHTDNIGNGFISHGDGCIDCRHINFFAIGPDFKENTILDVNRGQIDIPVTISELMGFEMPHAKGEIMYELFK